MKNKIFALLAALALLPTITGCISTVDGHMKGGVPFVKDKIQSTYDRPMAQLIAAAKAVLAHNGTLIGDNTIANTLEGRIDTRTVWIRFEQIEERLVGVTVQARSKFGRAEVDLASDIDKQIALQLTTMH